MEVQSFEDEINRKAAFALERILENHESGRYDTKTALACMHTVFDTVSGISSQDIREFVEECVKQFEEMVRDE